MTARALRRMLLGRRVYKEIEKYMRRKFAKERKK